MKCGEEANFLSLSTQKLARKEISASAVAAVAAVAFRALGKFSAPSSSSFTPESSDFSSPLGN